MKIGKKTWVWGTASIALAAILTWALLPEYGSGYSEAQRRNWNGMMGLDPATGRQSMFFLLEEMAKLARKDAPEWKIDIPESFGDLPLEGLQIPFLKKLAEEGNGDASLELAFRAEFDNTSNDNAEFSFPSLESVYQLETYLPMAVKQGRAGADFLCCLFEYRKKGGDDAGVKDLDGYQSFLARMDEGDFALGKVYLYLDPNGEEALSRLAMGLRKKADCGDVTALRDFGYLAILKHSRVRYENFLSELGYYREGKISEWIMPKIQEVREQLVLSSPSAWSYLIKREKEISDWLKGFEWKRILRKMEEPLDILREAADKGDLHAKYLWVKYAETIKIYFSKGDWERYLKYADDLAKVGGVYSGIFCDGDLFAYSINDQFPEALFYQTDSVRRIIHKLEERSQNEYVLIFPNKSRGEILNMNVSASFRMDTFSSFVYADKFSIGKQMSEDKQEVIQLLEKAAEKGDPSAIFQLSKILSDYGERESDGLRAWELLEKFKKWVENVRGSVMDDNIWHSESTENGLESWGIPIGDSIEVQKINIVSRHGDMPGMTVKKALEQFLEDSEKERYREKQKETLKAQFEKRGFKAPEDKK